MNNRQLVTIVAIPTILAAILITAISSQFGQAVAAPIQQDEREFVSISALAFEPIQPNTSYKKDVQRQILHLTTANRNLIANKNIFIAPLMLHHGNQILGLSLFGEDFDNQGEIRLRLKRCDHSQARCVTLAETGSTVASAQGQFETPVISMSNEFVDNNFFSYFLELELTALLNSGPRSVRLEVSTATSPPTIEKGQWSLSGELYRFTVSNGSFAQVKICTNNLSHLDNVTHYPYIVVDGVAVGRLGSDSCKTVSGYSIEIRRDFGAGVSTGSYE